MIQTFEFILGMVIFYLVFSPRFRRFAKKCINSWNPYHRDSPMPITSIAATPIKRTVRKKSPDVNGSGQLEVDEETLAEWTRNPDVKVRS
jgi:hypothetical protein